MGIEMKFVGVTSGQSLSEAMNAARAEICGPDLSGRSGAYLNRKIPIAFWWASAIWAELTTMRTMDLESMGRAYHNRATYL